MIQQGTLDQITEAQAGEGGVFEQPLNRYQRQRFTRRYCSRQPRRNRSTRV